MPSLPKFSVMNATSMEIVNAIRKSASAQYQQAVPLANSDIQSLRDVGTAIMAYEPLQNEFLSTLFNRIGRVIVTSKTFYNPWRAFKKGQMEFGESIEEIFVNIANAQDFDPETAAEQFMKREIPDVRSAFHVMNYQKFYKVTVSNQELRQAFLSWQGITDLIAKIVESMYTAHNYDEFLMMKYCLAQNIINGRVYLQTVPELTKANITDIVTEVKKMSNNFVYLSDKYNEGHVYNHTPKNEQYIITTSDFDAMMDVNVLATAFNMDKAEFMGHRIQVDSFGELDTERLKKLLGSAYVEISTENIENLKALPAVLVDKDFFMIFDNLYEFTEDYNGQGLYWQYWYHTWKTFSCSPFANACAFNTKEGVINSLLVEPSSFKLSKDATYKVEVTYDGEGFFNQNYTVEMSDTVKPYIRYDGGGAFTVLKDNPENKILTVTLLSAADPSVRGSLQFNKQE